MYQKRFYRDNMKSKDLLSYRVSQYETDLFVSAEKDFSSLVKELIIKYRTDIQEYGRKNQDFIKSLKPIKMDITAPQIVQHMILASEKAGVGPMASVAGALSQYVGNELRKGTNNLIIENGGDIFLATEVSRKIMIYAGKSIFSNKLGIIIDPEDSPVGICTSSGTLGHSLSFGKADAVVILSKDTLLADAAATATCNIVRTKDDIHKGIDFIKNIDNIEGAVIILDDKLGVWGNIRISK